MESKLCERDICITRPLDQILRDIGHVLVTSHELLMTLFSYLGYKDLVIASQVCKDWRDIIRYIRSKRRLRYMTAHPDYLFTSESKMVNNLPPQMSILETLLDQIKTSKGSKKYYCFGFAVGGWMHRNDVVTKYSLNGGTLSQVLRTVLPKDSDLTLIKASGMIGSVESTNLKLVAPSFTPSEKDCEMWYFRNSMNSPGYSIEVEECLPTVYRNARHNPLLQEPFDGLSLLLIPRQFGVKVKMFEVHEQNFYKTYRANLPEAERKIDATPLTSDEFNLICDLTAKDKLKSLLMFSSNMNKFSKLILTAASSREDNQIAIGGGLVDWVQQSGDPFQGTVGIAISGSNVQAASIVIPRSARTENSFRDELKKLKQSGPTEGHTMAFMFSCCGRGSSWYRKSPMKSPKEYVSLESRVFRSMFPKTPLFGFFGDGEIGTNYYETEESGSPCKKRKKMNGLFHQFSTVFVLISVT